MGDFARAILLIINYDFLLDPRTQLYQLYHLCPCVRSLFVLIGLCLGLKTFGPCTTSWPSRCVDSLSSVRLRRTQCQRLFNHLLQYSMFGHNMALHYHGRNCWVKRSLALSVTFQRISLFKKVCLLFPSIALRDNESMNGKNVCLSGFFHFPFHIHFETMLGASCHVIRPQCHACHSSIMKGL